MRLRLAIVSGLGLVAAACGSSSPSPGPTAPSGPPGVTTTSIAVNGPESLKTGVQAQFTAMATRSDGTVLDVTTSATWSSSGGSVLAVSSSGLVTPMTVGASTISATSQSRSGTLRLTVGLSDQDKSHLIEALFLGSGPWALQGNTGCRADGVLRSLSTDVQYTLTASTDLSPSQQELFFTPFRQWNSVKNNAGRFTETVQSLDAGTPFRDGLPVGFIYAMFLDDTFGAKCGAAGSGCADAMSSAGNVNVITRGGITLRRTIGGSVFVHESGHMLGLCHVDHRIALAQDVSVMGGSSNSNVTTLTAEEVEALSRVHAARLQPGARRSDFVRAGLIIENGASIASPGGRLTTSPGGQFRILTDRIPLHR